MTENETETEETEREAEAKKVAGAITNIVTGVMALWPLIVQHKVPVILLLALFGSHAVRSASVQAIKGDLAGAIETLADDEHGPPTPEGFASPSECITEESYHKAVVAWWNDRDVKVPKIEECRAILDVCDRTGDCD